MGARKGMNVANMSPWRYIIYFVYALIYALVSKKESFIKIPTLILYLKL